MNAEEAALIKQFGKEFREKIQKKEVRGQSSKYQKNENNEFPNSAGPALIPAGQPCVRQIDRNLWNVGTCL